MGLSDEDRDTESVRERIKNDLNRRPKRMYSSNVVWNLSVGSQKGSLEKRPVSLVSVSQKEGSDFKTIQVTGLIRKNVCLYEPTIFAVFLV